MMEARRLDLSEIDDWRGELTFRNGEVLGTPAPRTPRTVGASWSRARDLMHRVFPGALVDTGHTGLAARSSSRSRYLVPVDVNGEFSTYAVLLPNDDNDDHDGVDREAGSARVEYAARARREWRVLAQMAREPAIPFRAAKPVALVLDGDAPVLVVSHVTGFNLQQHRFGEPASIVASLAAAVHRLDVDVPGPATRREDALARIAALESIDAPGVNGAHESLVREAIAYAKTVLPPAEPARFVHGAFSPERILQPVSPLGDQRPGLIDFEDAASGDPARDIALLTCGVKKPLGIEGGLPQLLEAYARAGGAPIEESDVHVYEALLLASIIRANRETHATPPEVQRLSSLLRRS
jgi:aminoglycoside phosphotransferase (APT) family kinase protein